MTHTAYLALFAGFVALCISVAITLGLRKGLHLPGVRWWVASGWLVFLGAGLNGLQSALPNTISYVLAVVLLVLGIGAVLIGTQKFFEAPINFERIVLLNVLAAVLGAWVFGLVTPSVVGRVVVSHITFMLMLLLTGYVASSYARGVFRRAARWLIYASLVLCAAFGIRAVLVINNPLMTHSFSDLPLNYVAFALMITGNMMFSFAMLSLVSAKIRQLAWEQEFVNTISGSINAQGLEQLVHELSSQGRWFSVLLIEPDQRATTDHDLVAARAWDHAAGNAPWLAVRGLLEADTHPMNLPAQFATTAQRQTADSQLLHVLATTINDLLREGSFVAQLPNNRLCVVLSDCSVDDAYLVAERVRSAVEYLDAQDVGFMPEHTISIGVSGPRSHPLPWASLFDRAAQALDQAQQSGRNRIELSGINTVIGQPATQ